MVFGKRENGFPVIGVVDELGKLLGFASWEHLERFQLINIRLSIVSIFIMNIVAVV